MKAKYKRLWLLVAALVFLGGATALIFSALEENLVFFFTPSDLVQSPPPPEQVFRLGGLVEDDSLVMSGDQQVDFSVTDFEEAIPVHYQGLLPDLFREGQGVVAQGYLGADGIFMAEQILAKHDENYMPPELVDALKETGMWQHGPGGQP